MPAYNLRLGPLAYIAPADSVSKTLGEALENVGAVLVPAERRPRPLKLKVPVEGDPHTEADTKAAGDRLRRQTEQLLENRRWLSQGLYLYWEVGEDLLAAWVLLGGGELSEQDPGVSFGMYDLELTDLYVVGATSTHRPGRRMDLVDRRDATVPRDTRGLLYTDAFASTPIGPRRVYLPGAASMIRASSGIKRTPIYGPQRGGPIGDSRFLWLAVEALDGEVITYIPDKFMSDLDPRRAPAVSEDFGAVKAWDMNSANGGGYSFDPLATAGSQDYEPDVHFGWERLYGTPTRSDRYLALENGSVRVRWLGGALGFVGAGAGGLVLEWWDENYPGGPRYRPEGRFIHAASELGGGNYGFEVTIPELTPERGILEIRFGDRCLRVILQRGWVNLGLESYVDQRGAGADRAWLQWTSVNPSASGDAFHFTPPAPGTDWDWVQGLATDRDSPDTSRVVVFAPAADTYTYDVGAANLSGDAGCTITQPEEAAGPNLVAAQVAPPFPIESPIEYGLSTVGPVAEIMLVDSRGVPVLVSR